MEYLLQNAKELDSDFCNKLNNDNKNIKSSLIKNDSLLNEDLYLNSRVDEVLKNSKLTEFRSILDSSHTKITEKSNIKKPVIKQLYMKIAIAASFLLIIGLGFSFLNDSTTTKDDIYADYFEAFPTISQQRSGITEQNGIILFNEASMNYQNGNYTEAISKFENITKQHKENIAAHLFLGVSYMGVNNYDKAELIFSFIIETEDVYYTLPANWYLALCYLKTSNIEGAKNIFSELSSFEGFYKDKSISILQNINEFLSKK